MEFALDIIDNQRLYCAKWSTLNDPMEGIYSYYTPNGHTNDVANLIDDIRIAKHKIRICSLCGTFNRHLMWAHYADGFRGMAIEVDVPPSLPQLVKVKYRGVFHTLDITAGHIPDETAREILSSKYREWKYEKEVRLLHDSEYLTLPNPIRRVIIGHRMPDSLIEVLRRKSDAMGIILCRIGIGDEGLDADRFYP